MGKTGGYETIDPPTDDDSGPTSREGGRGHREGDEMCGITEHTPNMATVLKGKRKKEEKQMRLASMTKRVERVTEEVIKTVKHLTQKRENSPVVKLGEHWTQTKTISPQGTKAIEQHLAAMER